MTLRDIKNRIGSLKTIQKTTNVMKVISSVKMSKFRRMLDFSREPLQIVRTIITDLLAKTHDLPAIFNTKDAKEEKKIALLVLSSDRGLCSNFNTLINKRFQHLLVKDFAGKDLQLFCAGKRFSEWGEKKFQEIPAERYLLSDYSKAEQISELTEKLIAKFISGQFDKLFVLHYNFANMMTQDLCLTQILPFDINNSSANDNENENLELSSDDCPAQALDFFGRELLKLLFYNMFMNHITTENCFRMKAMDSATTNTKNMIAEKELVYNRMRQALITKDLIEIISGAESQNA